MAAWQSGTQAGRNDLDEPPAAPARPAARRWDPSGEPEAPERPERPDVWRQRPAAEPAQQPGVWQRPDQRRQGGFDPDQGRTARAGETRGAGPWQAPASPPEPAPDAWGTQQPAYGREPGSGDQVPRSAQPGEQWQQEWGPGAAVQPGGSAAASVNPLAAIVWVPGILGGLILALGWFRGLGSLVTAGAVLCLAGFVFAAVMARLDSRPEVRFNAIQSACLDVVTAAIAFVITAVVVVSLLQSILFPLLQLLYAGLRAFIAIRTLQGVRIKLPFVGELAELRANR